MRQHHAAASALPPPGAQQFEQLRRKHRMAILAALALLDADQHARRVDVGHLERHHLGDAQPGTIGRAEGGLVFGSRCRFEQPCDFLHAQHQRQLARLMDDREATGQIGPVERHGEEEAQRRNRAVDARRLHAGLRLVHLETANILSRRRVGRAAEEGRECLHAADVVTARVLGEATHGHVFDHALAQRAAGQMRRIGGHRMLLSS